MGVTQPHVNKILERAKQKSFTCLRWTIYCTLSTIQFQVRAIIIANILFIYIIICYSSIFITAFHRDSNIGIFLDTKEVTITKDTNHIPVFLSKIYLPKQQINSYCFIKAETHLRNSNLIWIWPVDNAL